MQLNLRGVAQDLYIVRLASNSLPLQLRLQARTMLRSSGVRQRQPRTIATASLDMTATATAIASASAQRDELWKSILATAYKDSELPTTDPSGLSLFGLFWPPFLWQTMRFQGNTMPPNHRKLIHAHGTVVKVAFKASSTRYTGIFASGGIGLARLSLAQQGLPFRPGLAVKVLVDGAPSLNFVAMFDREGQKSDTNFFKLPLSSKLPAPTTFKSAVLTGSFQFANTTLSLNPAEKPENASTMPLLEPAQITSSGAAVAAPVVPYKVVFQPEPTTFDLYAKINETYKDMRTALAQVKPGTTLYSMHLYENAGDEAGVQIGALVTESDFVASKFGDDDLFFKHMRTRQV